MRPFYFGGLTGQLFGVYDPPQIDRGRGSIVVLCYPYGQEYFYAFRAYRNLATGLARVGFHVFRFDYFGTGDSAGDVDQASLQRWIADVIAAVDETRSSLGHSSVSLVGLRLGASLAVMAATECRDVDRLVLWQPVIQGSEYVADLQASHLKWLQNRSRVWSRVRLLPAEDELLGSRVTQSLRRDLERINLWSLATRPARHVLVVSQDEGSEYVRLAEHLQKLGPSVEVKRVEDQRIWSMRPDMQWGLVPNHVLRTIISWFRSSGDE
jgi:exosortase A-associated hydrolase 2